MANTECFIKQTQLKYDNTWLKINVNINLMECQYILMHAVFSQTHNINFYGFEIMQLQKNTSIH